MAVNPPPIQEAWRTDQSGRLISPAWIVWLQGLMSADTVQSIISNEYIQNIIVQEYSNAVDTSTITYSSSIDYNPIDELKLHVYSLNEPIGVTSTASDDSQLFAWMSF